MSKVGVVVLDSLPDGYITNQRINYIVMEGGQVHSIWDSPEDADDAICTLARYGRACTLSVVWSNDWPSHGSSISSSSSQDQERPSDSASSALLEPRAPMTSEERYAPVVSSSSSSGSVESSSSSSSSSYERESSSLSASSPHMPLKEKHLSDMTLEEMKYELKNTPPFYFPHIKNLKGKTLPFVLYECERESP